MAQEEELFRRSNYFKTLSPEFYPLRPRDVVYSPEISIIKDQDYDDLRKPVSVAMIAAAAPKYPDAIAKNKIMRYSEPKDYEAMQVTIDNIFRAAYKGGHDVLVLGALGCGCYANPPLEVIDIFNAALKRYQKCFACVVFAVYSRKDHNFQLFSEHINDHIQSRE